MHQLRINGPCKLSGEVNISTSKNSSLPIICATLLNSKKINLKKLPELADVKTMLKLLSSMGSKVEVNDDQTLIKNNEITNFVANYDLVKTMRASFLVLGPLIARFGKAQVSLPGGCAIGQRPIDIHLEGLKKLGASIKLEGGYVFASASKLKGADIVLPFPSVGATEQLIMAATLAEGVTTIENCAREPEIEDLAKFINSMGGKVQGAGFTKISVEGVNELNEIKAYTPISDRIEAGTFIVAGLITNSEILIKNVNPDHLKSVIEALLDMGARLEIGSNYVRVLKSEKLNGKNFNTAPYPGFPTDMQAQMIALATGCKSSSIITEEIFENRFMHVSELLRMGANIILNNNAAVIEGNKELTGAPVMCTDLRASAALILAALRSTGETKIQRVYHLDRGYEKIDEKLRALGVEVIRENA